MSQTIYLDHAAATTPYPEVVALARDVLEKDLGNPSSVHTKGKEARFLIDEARMTVAQCFGVEGKNVTFTSGATEALHLAIVGGYLGQKGRGEQGKILVSPIAHSCVQGAASFLEKHCGVERINIPLQKNGHFDFRKIDEELLNSVDVVVVEHANSDIGVLQDIKKLGEYVHRYTRNVESSDPKLSRSPIFIVDAAASVVSCPGVFDLLKTDWGPDMIALSGEKFGGLSGAGALVRRNGVSIEPVVAGSHEFGLRGGTENLIGIVAFGKAIDLHFQSKNNLREHFKELAKYANDLWNEKLPELQRLDGEVYVDHIFCSLLTEQHKADLVVSMCDRQGLCIASGSACSSGAVGGNKALKALGFSDSESTRSLRLSFGRTTTKDDIQSAFEVLRLLLDQ